jgi:type III secretion protein R
MGTTPDPLLIAALMLGAGLLPFAALMVSSYTKIVIVLGLLRQALGTQQVPPTLVLNGIAIILSVFVMAPVFEKGWDNLQPKMRDHKFGTRFEDLPVAGKAMGEPFKEFLNHHVEDRYRRFFIRAAEHIWPKERAKALSKDDLLVLVPSFTVSELSSAFEIGFVLYLAFVVVDLVVGNILLAMGMSMTSPTLISVPFKLLLFVMLDGWPRLIEGLLLTYK